MILRKKIDRFVIVTIVFSIIFSIIMFRLATIMIVEGERYREEAENRIFKSIPLNAPRGEIRDRYGRLLAGNRPSFTVQIMKSEVVDEKINEVALYLIKILEENGDQYNDEFPIVFTEDGGYVFTYDLSIQSWKERYGLEEVKSAKDAFEVLRERYGIEEEDPYKVQEQFLNIPDLNVPISVRTWKFRAELDKEHWLGSYSIQDYDISAAEAFQILRNRIYRIPEEYSSEDARKIMVIREQLRKQGYLQYQPVTVAQDISAASVAQIEENIMKLPGVNISVEPIRYYPEGQLAAHLLGYLGKISQQNEIDYYVKELKYSPNDIIGKTGIEQKFEEDLKGKNGSQRVVVDSRGRLIRVLERVEPIPGDTIYLTIDANLQRVAEKTLEEVIKTLQEGGTYETKWGSNRLMGSRGPMKNATSGSVVVLDVKTGEVLALANYPSYDPNLFSMGISMTDWRNLMPPNERDPLSPRPLLNIALSTAIQPGSTFKMLVGLAALEQGLSPQYKILDRGYVQIGGHSFGNWLWNQSRRTMGYQNLYQAIADSNNFYFYCLASGYDYGIGRSLPIEMNIDILTSLVYQFGLNDRTGIEIDIPRERAGRVPGPENRAVVVKSMLRSYLRRQITLHDLDDTKVQITNETLDHVIEEIVSWTEENPSRQVVYNRLLELGIKKEKLNPLTDTIKYNYFVQVRWTISDTLNFAIGQGEHSYTPIQMAQYMAILANGGYRYSVSAIRKIQSYDGSNIREYPPELIGRIQLNNYNHLKEINYGMHLVTTTGTARAYFNRFPVDVAGKTGTAQRSGKIPPKDEIEYLKKHLRSFGVTEEEVEKETLRLMEENRNNPNFQDKGYAMREAIKKLNPRIKNADLDQFKEDYDNYAWFTGFAPYDNPEIAISVLIFQGGSGGYAAPIFREIVAEYMGLNTTGIKDEFAIENRLAK